MQSAPIVANGSFEDVQIGPPFFSFNTADVPSWNHTTTGSGDAPLFHVGFSDGGGSVTVAGAGNQFVTMGGGAIVGSSTWDQVIAGFTPGNSYRLNFKMASENTGLGQSITVDFISGSATPAQAFSALASPANYWRDWEQQSMTFVANATSVDIRFSATTMFDVGLDDVNLVAVVPEPASLTLLGAGLIGIAGYGYRRRKGNA